MLKPSDEITITVRRAIGDKVLTSEMTLSAGVMESYAAPERAVYSAIQRMGQCLNEAENREAAYG